MRQYVRGASPISVQVRRCFEPLGKCNRRRVRGPRVQVHVEGCLHAAEADALSDEFEGGLYGYTKRLAVCLRTSHNLIRFSLSRQQQQQ